MATFNSFNIVDLYTKIFGIKGVRFAIPNTSSSNEKSSIKYPTLSLPGNPKSILGAPIFEQITIKASDTETYTFLDWPLIDISYQKTIVKTPIKGRNGSIKEYINIDDYQITIRGILINYNSDEYPYDLLGELENFCKKNKELQIISPVLNLLDVNNIVIESVKYPEVEGFNNMQPFVLECLSDEPIELIIQSANKQTKIIKGL